MIGKIKESADGEKQTCEGRVRTDFDVLLGHVVNQDSSKTLGMFETEGAAMTAYDEAVVRVLGLEAVTNNPIDRYMHCLGTRTYPAGNTASLYAGEHVPVNQFQGVYGPLPSLTTQHHELCLAVNVDALDPT